jgi:sarcosine oxidase, subunit gamma
MMAPTQVFPLERGGAAADRAALLGDHDGLRIADRTAWPRFGIKGPGSADWLRYAGIDLPEPNRMVVQAGRIVLRLGRNDIVLLSEDGLPGTISDLRQRWEDSDAPKGYSSWREEAWAWLHLDGPHLDQTLAGCCAVDLRLPASGRIAQTVFAHVDAVVIRRDGAADLWFDIAATGAVLATMRQDRGHG